MSDKQHRSEFEDFFERHAGEGEYYEYDPLAWQALAKRLDKDRKRRFIWWWWPGIGLLLVGLSLYGAYQWWQLNDGAEVTTFTQTAEEQNAHNEEIVFNQVADNLSNDGQVKTTEEKIETVVQNQETDHLSRALSENSQMASAPSSVSDYNDAVNIEITQRRQNVETQSTQPADVLEENQITKKEELITDHVKQESIKTELNPVRSEIITMLDLMPILALTVPMNTIEQSPEMEVSDIDEETSDNSTRKWGFSLLADYDGSFTPSNSAADWDWKIGANLQHRFTDKWIIGVGMSYVEDYYHALGDDYHTPYQGYWTNGVKPDAVSALCKMIEIPLSAMYMIDAKGDSRWSVHGALSSVMMLQEIYYYEYAEEDPTLRQSWMGTNTSQHLFSTIQLGVGYHQSINSRFSIELSPYANLPLSGIGHGSVSLSSIGLALRIHHF